MKRGEIWWAELGSTAGRRPVLLLSRNEAYLIREMVTIAPVTTRIRRIPSEVLLTPEDGMPKLCVVNLDTITTIAKSSLKERLTELTGEKMKAVEDALRFSLAME